MNYRRKRHKLAAQSTEFYVHLKKIFLNLLTQTSKYFWVGVQTSKYLSANVELTLF